MAPVTAFKPVKEVILGGGGAGGYWCFLRPDPTLFQTNSICPTHFGPRSNNEMMKNISPVKIYLPNFT